MTKLEDIAKALAALSDEELDRFRAWFEEFDADRFDQRIERDALAGKLDWLAEEALDEHRAGRTTEL